MKKNKKKTFMTFWDCCISWTLCKSNLEIEVTTVTKKSSQTFVDACEMMEGCIPLSRAYNKKVNTLECKALICNMVD